MKTLLKILAGFVTYLVLHVFGTRLVNKLKCIWAGLADEIYSRFPRLVYKKARAGNERAQWFLGRYWAEGIEKPKANVPADLMAACYAKAAMQGNARAGYILGVLSEEGIGVLLNKVRAEACRRVAAKEGIVTIRDLVGHTKYDAKCASLSFEDLKEEHRTMMHGFINAYVPSFWGH